MGFASSRKVGLFRFPGTSSRLFLAGMDEALRKVFWAEESATAAFCVGGFGGTPSNGTTVVIDGQTYTFRTTILNTRAGDVLRGSSATQAMENLQAAINREAGVGVKYSTATPPHATVTALATGASIRIEYLKPGPSGNGLVCAGNPFESTWTAGGGSPSGKLYRGAVRLRGTSDQKMTVLVHLYDNGAGPRVRFVSDREGHTEGMEHNFLCGEGLVCRIIAGPCQFFLHVEGLRYTGAGSVICGGVPWVSVPNPDGEVWWSMGDFFGYGEPAFPASNPRICLRLKDGVTNSNPWASEGMYNGVYCPPYAAFGNDGVAQILVVTATNNVDRNVRHADLAYIDGTEIYYEAFVAWGAGNTDDPVVRGQLWDARIGSLPMDMDTLSPEPDTSWITFTDQYPFGTLWLRWKIDPPTVIKPKIPIPPPANYTY